MAIQALNATLSTTPDTVLDGEAGAPIIAAMQRMMGADQVALYLVDHANGSVEPLAEWTPRAPMSLAYRTGLVEVATGDKAAGGGTWLEDSGGTGRAALATTLDRRGGRTAVLVSTFTQPGAATRARALRLLPDMVTLIGHHIAFRDRLRRVEMENAAAVAALDHGECGVVAVAADGSPIFCNAAAERFLEKADGLHLRRGEVRPTGYAEAVRFRAALEEVADGRAASRSSRERPRAMAMLLPRRDGGRPTVLAIAPAERASGDRRDGHPGGPVAILYILEAGQSPAARLDAVCRLHGLSRVETSLIMHLIHGRTLAEAAKEMRVKLETARAYLKHVFTKTGTHRQIDLVALISRYGRAMRGDFDFQPA